MLLGIGFASGALCFASTALVVDGVDAGFAEVLRRSDEWDLLVCRRHLVAGDDLFRSNFLM